MQVKGTCVWSLNLVDMWVECTIPIPKEKRGKEPSSLKSNENDFIAQFNVQCFITSGFSQSYEGAPKIGTTYEL